MNSSLFFCLIGLALLNQGSCRPNSNPDYPQDGDGEGDYDEDESETELGPPAVIVSPALVLELDPKDTAVFPCKVDGNKNSYSRVWRKDNTGLYVGSVTQTKDPRISKNDDEGTLKIENVNESDVGTYSCLVGQEKQQEVVHSLHVKSPAKILSISPNGPVHTVHKNQNQTLECQAVGYPKPSIKWFHNGHHLIGDNAMYGSQYEIHNATLADEGIYKCTAFNGHQPDEKSIEIQIYHPPTIEVKKKVVTAGEGYESVLKCIINGSSKPEVQVKWFRENEQKPVVPNQRIKMEKSGNDHFLRILKTQATDFMTYRCEIASGEGVKSANMTLTGNPAPPEYDTVATLNTSKNPVLTFNIESYAPIKDYELQYKRQEDSVWVSVKPMVSPSMDGRIFSVKHELTDLEPGVYVAKLRAENNYGWSEFSDVVTFPKEHEGDLTQTGLLAISASAASELRISAALLVSLLVAHFYC